MKILLPSWQFERSPAGEATLTFLERIGRTCYKSESRITPESAGYFIRKRIDEGHDSVIEHETATVRLICDRGVTHEIVRHRIGSYTQESTRYCNYGHEGDISVILPVWYKELWLHWQKGLSHLGEFDPELVKRYQAWYNACKTCEAAYLDLLRAGALPQEARDVLPTSLKTELVITYNLREWRHFFRLRTSQRAHPQMRELTIPMLEAFKGVFVRVFDDIVPEAT